LPLRPPADPRTGAPVDSTHHPFSAGLTHGTVAARTVAKIHRGVRQGAALWQLPKAQASGSDGNGSGRSPRYHPEDPSVPFLSMANGNDPPLMISRGVANPRPRGRAGAPESCLGSLPPILRPLPLSGPRARRPTPSSGPPDYPRNLSRRVAPCRATWHQSSWGTRRWESGSLGRPRSFTVAWGGCRRPD